MAGSHGSRERCSAVYYHVNMAQRVDHNARRETIGKALWQTLLEHGVQGVTIRRVAARTGWTTGAVQYYFKTRTALLEYAFMLVQTQTVSRIHRECAAATDDGAAMVAFRQVLPDEGLISKEAEVWFNFIGLAFSDETLGVIARTGQSEVTAAIANQVRRSQEVGYIRADVDAHSIAAEGLAVADGLSINMVFGEIGDTEAANALFLQWFESKRAA